MKDINGNEIKMCQVCGQRKATVHVKTNINGVQSEKNLCEHCAAKINGANMINEMWNGMNIISEFINGGGYRTTPRVCPVCGTSEREVRKDFRLGCSACYDTFKDIIEDLFTQMAGRPYSGRTPNDIKVEAKPKEKINPIEDSASQKTQEVKSEVKQVSEAEAIEQQIENAVKARDYKEAARLQDMLDKIKGGSK
ncbi:MAG: hypothetical protein K2I79_01040 [Clostridia bacterium]|nr:hypothetical protein [Clostridia bacterium]